MARTRTKKKTASSTDTSTATNTAKQDTTSDLEINETATITSTSTATFVPRPGGDNFTARDFEILSENENMRYMPYSKSNKVGHAVIVKNEKGEKIALQYAIPQGDKEKAPEVQQLLNIHEITRFGHTRYMAETPEHTVMYAKRYLQAKVKDNEKATEEEMDIAYFSPSEGGEKEPFWGGGNKEVPLFSDDLPPAMAKDLKKELADIKKKLKGKKKIKGGEELVIDHESVRWRDAHKTRTPDQNTVMGGSAKDAYQEFLEALCDELSPEMKKVLQKAVDAPLRHLVNGNWRPEWLHAYGYSLTPANQNPQNAGNLGAGPKWANTEMMVLERIAKWFALNCPNSKIVIKPEFEMILDSELINKIKFEVTIQEKQKLIQFLQELNPFQKWPSFRKPTDLAQGTAIAHSILRGVPPISQQKISRVTDPNFARVTETHYAPSSSAMFPGSSSTPPFASSGFFTQPSFAASAKEHEPKHLFPTHLKFEKSLVQILTTSQEVNYDEPWMGIHTMESSGTGLIIKHGGQKYILTNAHVVENKILTRVRLANNRKKKYEARCVCVSYQCDLALLQVDDPDFDAAVEEVELGDMVQLQDKVQTVGFPMGGSEISVTKGIVSRIEVEGYSMSGFDMLQVQIDAAINPGNSGGPVFSGNKVVGIAFQGYSRSQNLGYMIPMPIVRHFLTEAFSNKPYRGFPILPIVVQTLENPYLREYYGMTDQQTGVRLTKVDNLCDAYNKLKPDDILLEIDSLPISNEGTVDIQGIGNCIDFIHVAHAKFIGDTVDLKILRRNAETKKAEIHNITVTLDHVPLETEMVGQNEFDKMPTYYIASGISFVPLTRNYLEGKGSDLEQFYVLEESCLIADLPKKSPTDEFVVINEVLDCTATQGYADYVNTLVKEVNGKPIKNLRDLIVAIEENEGSLHNIKTSSKTVLVVKKMSPEEHAILLKRYRIPADRSEDLMGLPPVSQAMSVEQVPVSVQPAAASIVAAKPPVPVVQAPIPAALKPSTSSLIGKRLKRVEKPAVSLKGKEKALEAEEVSDDETDVSDSDVELTRALTAEEESLKRMMPGVKRYRAAVDRIEAWASLVPDDDEEIEDEEYQQGMNESDNEVEEKKTVGRFSNRLFSRKRNTQPDEEEAPKSRKRQTRPTPPPVEEPIQRKRRRML